MDGLRIVVGESVSIVGSDSKRTWYLSPTGKRHYVEPGWEKGWIFENVYGWTWIGPLAMCPMKDKYITLLCLPYEPDVEERRTVHERFKDVRPPVGNELTPDPFESKTLSERQCE